MRKRPGAPSKSEQSEKSAWTFLTNHAHVLICIAGNPQTRIRDLADRVGITERAVQRIIFELEEAGYLAHERDGRRNIYRVRPTLPLRHPVERKSRVAALLALGEDDAS
jgi:DNA-binding MarR family transcriptional regulator